VFVADSPLVVSSTVEWRRVERRREEEGGANAVVEVREAMIARAEAARLYLRPIMVVGSTFQQEWRTTNKFKMDDLVGVVVERESTPTKSVDCVDARAMRPG
jgi:hypothetical protein